MTRGRPRRDSAHHIPPSASTLKALQLTDINMAYICHPSPLAGQPPPAPLYYRKVYNSSLAEGVEFLGHQNSLEDPNLRFQITLLIAICSTNVPGVLTMEATFRAHKRRIIRLWIINTFQNKTSCNEMFPLLIKLTVRWKKDWKDGAGPSFFSENPTSLGLVKTWLLHCSFSCWTVKIFDIMWRHLMLIQAASHLC